MFWQMISSNADNFLPMDYLSIQQMTTELCPVFCSRSKVLTVSRFDLHRSRGNGGVHARLANDLLFGLDLPEQAVMHYRAALDRDPDNLAVIENLGLALIEMDRTAAALAFLHRAVDLNPVRGEARYRLAAALLKNGDSKQARVEAETAVRMSPNDPVADHIRGITLAASGQLEAAKASFEKALH